MKTQQNTNDGDVLAGLLDLARRARDLGQTSPRGVRSELFDVASRLEALTRILGAP